MEKPREQRDTTGNDGRYKSNVQQNLPKTDSTNSMNNVTL